MRRFAPKLALLCLTLLLAACQGREANPYRGLPTATPQPTATASAVPPSADQPTAPPQPTATAAPTATPGPEPDWREAPILPETISPRVLAIYRDGQAQGRNPRHVSVIGDCQAIPFVFLGPYERGELTPSSAETYLWDAIQYFQGSFNRSGMAVRGGFTAASILNPLHADPSSCIPGETPLTCEYRLYNPAFVFINLETWLDPATVDRYEAYLREILDYVISRGSVPILITKADASELGTGEHVINPAIVRAARDYDVPLVNFWRAAQYLPNYGIDPTREGFHLSPEGYALKNTLALRALYQVWQAVQAESAASTGAPAPSPQATRIPLAAPQVTLPDCPGGCLFFGTAVSHDGAVTPNGVFAYDPASGRLTAVLGPGFDLQDVSADGQRLLVNDETRLFEVSLADGSVRLLSDSLFSLGGQAAYWSADESRVLFLDQTAPLETGGGQAIGLFPTGRDDLLVFESGACTARAACQSSGVYRLGPDQVPEPLESYLRPVFSPDGRQVAFLNPAAATPENYYHIGYLLLEEVDRGLPSRRIFYFAPVRGFMVFPDVRAYAFSPDSRWLFVLYDFYSAYYERSLRLQTYLLDVPAGILYDYGRLDGPAGSLNPRLVWSPQSDRLLFFLTTLDPSGNYALNVYQTNLLTGERLALLQADLLSSNDYFYITTIYWP